MASKTPIRISIAFEESSVPRALPVNRMCIGNSTEQRLNSVSNPSLRDVFTEHGPSSRYVMLYPMTRLYQAETFRAAIESEAVDAGLQQEIVFENPHAALTREWSSSLAAGVEARPAAVVVVAVTRENELFVSACDKNVWEGAFMFKSRPMSSADDTAAAIETVVSEAFEFIKRAVSDPGATVLLASEARGVSRRVVTKLYRLLRHIDKTLEITLFHLEAALKGALRPKPNPSRIADAHLREAEAALEQCDYRVASLAIEAARRAYPCDAVRALELDFRKKLSAAAAEEKGTRLRRFEASIERHPDRLVQLWRDIAMKSPSGSHAAKDAQRIAKFFQGVEER